MQSDAEKARTLALAYQYRQGIDRLERELSHLAGNIPPPLQRFVAGHAFAAVAAHVAGEIVDVCPWDQDDPQPLRAALAALWWQCHNQYLVEYREGK